MSNSLGNLMRQLSFESGSAQDQVGAEEILVVTDEATTELEESIEELAASVNEVVETDSAIEKVIDATVSLESNMALLDTMIESGQRLSGPGFVLWANGIRDSFEARYIDESVWAGELDGLVTSFEANTDEDKSGEAKVAGESIIKRLTAMLKKAWEWAKESWDRFVGNIEATSRKLNEAAVALKTAANDTKAKAVGVKNIKATAFKSLVFGEKIDVSGALTRVSSGLLEHKDKAKKLKASIDAATAAGSTVEAVAHTFDNNSVIQGADGTYQLVIKDGKFIKSLKSVTLTKSVEAEKAVAEATPLTPIEVSRMADKIAGIAKEVGEIAASIKASYQAKKEFKTDNAVLAASITAAIKLNDNISSKVLSGSLKVARDAYTFAKQSLVAHAGKDKVETNEGEK